MKIKHWQGYGVVEAKKIADDSCTLHVAVSGDHECGLERDDMYDLFNWLVKKFDKSIDTYEKFYKLRPNVNVEDFYADGKEICHYRFFY